MVKGELAQQNLQVRQQFDLVRNVKTSHVHLRGSNLAPKALLVVYWNEEEQQAYLNTVALPDIPADKSLQLWADVDGEMINMGVISVEGDELVPIPYIPKAESLNLTLEPLGGSDHPNVEQIVANGKMI